MTVILNLHVVIVFVILFPFLYIIARLNIVNTLLLPFLAIYIFLYWACKYIFISKSFLLYKKRIKINYFEKLSMKSDNNAENKYFIIKLKK